MPIVKSESKKGFSFKEPNDSQCDSCRKKDWCKHPGKILPCIGFETISMALEKQAKRGRKSFEENTFDFKRKSTDSQTRYLVLKLLKEIKARKAQAEKHFYEVNSEGRMACFTMKEDYTYFERKLLELI